MGNREEEKVHRVERWVYGVAQALLLTSILATLYFLVMIKLAGNILERHLSMESHDRVWNGMSEQYHKRTDDVALYPPPQHEEEFPVWVDSVQSHVVFPVAVFLWEDTTIRPVSVPEHLRRYVNDLPRLIRPTTPRGERIKPDTVGSMILWQGEAKADSLHAHVKAFQHLGDQQAWGILYRFNDARRELAQEILAYNPKNILASGQWVSTTLDVSNRAALRLFSGDSLIASPPNLDTTRSKYAEDRKLGVWIEYYVSEPVYQLYISLLKQPRLLYFLLVVEVIMVAVLFYLHRLIKHLRKSDPLSS